MAALIAAAAALAVGATAAAAATRPKSPSAPDYAAASREAVEADLDALPLKRLIEQAASAGTKVEYTDSHGEKKVADFTGLGDADLSRIQLDYQLNSADDVAARMLELGKTYGKQFVEQRLEELKASDPTGFAMREEMGKSILGDLMAGKGLDPAMEDEVVQAERAGQAARGNILGSSSAAAEAMEVGNAGFRLWQQKLANASAFLSGTTPVAQFSSLAGGQQGASPFAPAQMQAGLNVNPNAGNSGANFALGVYGQQSRNWATDIQTSPWQTMLGSFSGSGMEVGWSEAVKKWGH